MKYFILFLIFLSCNCSNDPNQREEKTIDFKVLRSIFYFSDVTLGGTVLDKTPKIKFLFENNMDCPVSNLRLVGTLKSPGRSVPWIRENLNFEIPGGVERGEKLEFVLTLNRFSDWGFLEFPKEYVLTTEVVEAICYEKKPSK